MGAMGKVDASESDTDGDDGKRERERLDIWGDRDMNDGETSSVEREIKMEVMEREIVCVKRYK
ncbi:hypothetical protein KIN20_018741 [Parelaphostrongylus tenuis]|uniref:Uncharacterized protein n=1 Tax=Parelaphostrongylus tenuis TaxID=148309 RepID=A0AAD5N4L9_PARTN|nr:hypothetical protein KIN20_018741 [Parelaphostrongylus tenuis]